VDDKKFDIEDFLKFAKGLGYSTIQHALADKEMRKMIENLNKNKRVICLFDVDQTLTPARTDIQ
jgi:5S rRNA maturation endonuclease (ribonuclease M5)